jgi:hypothetical protein
MEKGGRPLPSHRYSTGKYMERQSPFLSPPFSPWIMGEEKGGEGEMIGRDYRIDMIFRKEKSCP